MKLQLSIAITLLLPLALQAQDMPLSQIVIPGEGWQRVKGDFKPISVLKGFAGPNAQLHIYCGADGQMIGLLNKTASRLDEVKNQDRCPFVFFLPPTNAPKRSDQYRNQRTSILEVETNIPRPSFPEASRDSEWLERFSATFESAVLV